MEATTLSDKDWEARNDFRSLTDAWQIQKDTKRYNAAVAAGKKLRKEKKEELTAENAIIGKAKKMS